MVGELTVFNFILIGQVFHTFYRFVFLGHCQKSSQVGCVGTCHNQGEKPPHCCGDSRTNSPTSFRLTIVIFKALSVLLW